MNLSSKFDILKKEFGLKDFEDLHNINLPFYNFYLSSKKDNHVFLIVIDKNLQILIYLCCVLNLKGAYNEIFNVIKIYKLCTLDSQVLISLINDKSFLYFDIIESYIYNSNTKQIKTENNLCVRINIPSTIIDDFLDVKFDNLTNYYISKILEKENIIPILSPDKLLFNDKLQLNATLLPYKISLSEKITQFFVDDLEKFLLKKNKRFYNKIVLNIYILLIKIYNKLKPLQKYEFLHGDLKLNNIVIDMHTKKMKDIDIFFIDFGNSYIIHNDKEIYGDIIDINTGKPVSDKKHLFDISFFIMNFYIYGSYFFNTQCKNNKNLPNLIETFECIMEKEIISHLYNHECILSKNEIISCVKNDKWSLYVNNEAYIEKNALNFNKDKTKNCFYMKNGIQKNCYDIMLDKVVSLSTKLSIKI